MTQGFILEFYMTAIELIGFLVVGYLLICGVIFNIDLLFGIKRK
jgi:hypothetical protein